MHSRMQYNKDYNHTIEKTMTSESLGTKQIEAWVYYVHVIKRSQIFYVRKLDCTEVRTSSDDMTAREKH